MTSTFKSDEEIEFEAIGLIFNDLFFKPAYVLGDGNCLYNSLCCHAKFVKLAPARLREELWVSLYTLYCQKSSRGELLENFLGFDMAKHPSVLMQQQNHRVANGQRTLRW